MTPEDLIIRPSRDDDSAGMLAVLASVFSEYPGCVLVLEEEPEMQRPASAFAEHDGAIWTVERAGRLVGMVGLRPDHDEPGLFELKKLYLLAEARGLGLGRRLVEMVEAEARRRGARAMHLWSDTRFVTAHRVYERLGYQRLPGTRDLHDASDTTEFHFRKGL